MLLILVLLIAGWCLIGCEVVAVSLSVRYMLTNRCMAVYGGGISTTTKYIELLRIIAEIEVFGMWRCCQCSTHVHAQYAVSSKRQPCSKHSHSLCTFRRQPRGIENGNTKDPIFSVVGVRVTGWLACISSVCDLL